MPEWTPHVRARLASLGLPPAREIEMVEEFAQHLDDRWHESIAGATSEEEATSLALAQLRIDVLARHLAPLRQAQLSQADVDSIAQHIAREFPKDADGRIYASSEAGTIVLFRAGDTLDVLARNDLGESITATPAIAADTLYVRTDRHLWAFGS